MDNISLGMMLSNLREQKGLTQDDIAGKLHVRKTVVADIENDKIIDIDTPLVFIKGYIRSYAEIIGLSAEEYQPFINALTQQYKSYQVKNHIPNYQKRRRGIKLLLICLIILIGALGVTMYCINKESKSNLVEVSHYISPSSNHINS
ncbi:helix-turn-helix domain-containing protein [Gilliamella sp. wkB112]|uniref:helix-turn-helix domain-containing protein n=1 Tax=Gilliamella sp. wkB112 TaxID=3120257 RepID=UPI00080E982E|nr:helix-turn-helix domain-containing protein [Gilliamella apicola]OCG00361.1 hypothetical protein A9G12_04540 [Gilliamella apicola]